jgi:hypothetical protein
MKIKWQVSSKETGRFASFHKRSWPTADYVGDDKLYVAGQILSTSEYEPRDAKTGSHEPLHVRAAVWENPRIPSHGAFEYKKIGVVATLAEAKKLLQDYINAHPEILPPDLAAAPVEPVKKSARVKP